MSKIAIIVFPGSNCEQETARAVRRNDMEAEILRWNEVSRIPSFDGFVIVGGFSFEDRGRSGIVAAQEQIMREIKVQASQGKPVLGICNGAQILVESGLVPGYADTPQVTLTWNERKIGKEIVGTGFYSTWCTISSDSSTKKGAFNDWNGQMTIPIAHAEGRFLGTEEIFSRIEMNGQAIFRYTDEAGNAAPDFPVNPNGSMRNIAGMSNEKGNVVAMMPHPERTEAGDTIFQSMKRWIDERKGTNFPLPQEKIETPTPAPLPEYNAEIFVELIITDNTEATINQALTKRLSGGKVARTEFWGISQINGDIKTVLSNMIESGELVNLNKERPFVRIGTECYLFQKGTGLVPTSSFPQRLIVIEHSDSKGESTAAHLSHFLNQESIQIAHGVAWEVVSGNEQAILETQILANPNGAMVYRT